MRQLPALAAALLLPAAPALLLSTSAFTGAVIVTQTPAQAQSAQAVGKVAQAITVRIEGATQGSGVLVKREGTRYTVLTAWHVVNEQKPGEELSVYTADGQRHQLEEGSIKRLGDVDMAVLSFSSPNPYHVAQVGDVTSVSMGSPIYVTGFPLPTSAVPTRLMRFLDGKVVANSTVSIPNGYKLLYSNQTLPGMSGGAVLNAHGQLVGIHGQGETDSIMTEQQGVVVKTGTNQAMPISYYSKYSSGTAIVSSSPLPVTSDDYLAQARILLEKLKTCKHGCPSHIAILGLVQNSLKLSPTSMGYVYSAIIWNKMMTTAWRDELQKAIAIDPSNVYAYRLQGQYLLESANRSDNESDKKYWAGEAVGSLSKAVSLQPGSNELKQLLGEARAVLAR